MSLRHTDGAMRLDAARWATARFSLGLNVERRQNRACAEGVASGWNIGNLGPCVQLPYAASISQLKLVLLKRQAADQHARTERGVITREAGCIVQC